MKVVVKLWKFLDQKVLFSETSECLVCSLDMQSLAIKPDKDPHYIVVDNDHRYYTLNIMDIFNQSMKVFQQHKE